MEPKYSVLSQEDAERVLKWMTLCRQSTNRSPEEQQELFHFVREIQAKYNAVFEDFFLDCEALEQRYFPQEQWSYYSKKKQEPI